MKPVQRSVILFLCFALVALFVGGLLAIATPSHALEARVALDASMEHWKGLGGADDPAALAPPRVPDAVNAAPVYRSAFVELDRLAEADRKLLNLSALRTRPRDLAPIASRLDAVVAIVHDASRRSACEWNRGFYRTGTVTESDLAEFDRFLQLAAVVGAHAMHRAEANDIDAAIADLAAMRRMAGHAAAHPSVPQAAMGLFIDVAAFEVLERMFRDRELPALAAVNLTAPRDYRAAMRRTLLAQGTACLVPLADPNLASVRSLDAWQRDRAIAWFLDAMGGYVAALDEPGRRAVGTTTPPEGAAYARIFLPPPSLLDAIDTAATRSDMAAAAIKLRSHRDSIGAYPDSWKAATNPVTGVALQYRRDGTGFVLSARGDERLRWHWD